MVYYSSDSLNQTFAALSDPTRRAMLVQLAERGEQSAGALAAPFGQSLPSILKHIDVLARSGLVRREKRGRVVHCRLEPEPMRHAIEWLEFYEQFWTTRLDRLASLLEEKT